MLNKGKLVQIIGPVIDVKFEDQLPDIYNALEVYDDNGQKLVAEVHSHNGNNVVRAVAMTGTDGLRRGLEVVDTGKPIQVPVGRQTLGRIFNGMARILWTRDDNYYLQAPWRGTWALDGGTLMNQCIHNIDLINWMMDDEIDTVYAQTSNYIRNIEAEDYGVILIRYKSGKIATIEGSAIVYPKNLEETLTITGEKGMVATGGMAVNKINTWRVEGDNEQEYFSIDCGDSNSVYGYGHEALYKDFVDALNENREPLVNGIAGLNAVKIILATYKSQKTGLPIKFNEFLKFSTVDMR